MNDIISGSTAISLSLIISIVGVGVFLVKSYFLSELNREQIKGINTKIDSIIDRLGKIDASIHGFEQWIKFTSRPRSHRDGNGEFKILDYNKHSDD